MCVLMVSSISCTAAASIFRVLSAAAAAREFSMRTAMTKRLGRHRTALRAQGGREGVLLPVLTQAERCELSSAAVCALD